MYPLEMVERVAASHPWIRAGLHADPLTVILTAYRALQVPGTVFPWTAASVAGLLLPVALIVVAIRVFQRTQRAFSDLL